MRMHQKTHLERKNQTTNDHDEMMSNRRRSICYLVEQLMLFLALFFFQSNVLQQAEAANNICNDVHPHTNQRQHFSWSASLDRSTGKASSYESSIVKERCSLYKSITSYNNHQLLKCAEQLFTSYPTFLSQGDITFGFLRAVPLTKRDKHRRNHDGRRVGDNEIALQDRIFGIKFLTFGKATASTKRQPFKAVNHRSKDEVRPSLSKNIRTNMYTVKIPITGGLLAYYPALNCSQKKKRSSSRLQQHCGCLRFSLVKEQEQKKGAKFNEYVSSSTFSLVTEIADWYHPTISGPAPVSWIRKWTYRSTQSLFHAYVMWRFHHRCYHYQPTSESLSKAKPTIKQKLHRKMTFSNQKV